MRLASVFKFSRSIDAFILSNMMITPTKNPKIEPNMIQIIIMSLQRYKK